MASCDHTSCLSGQQQRVALTRALVTEPYLLLLNQPPSNLGASLRHEMKTAIRQLQKSLGLTAGLVTHDQDEAISDVDRMVRMRNGRVEQIGGAEYHVRPTSFAICGGVHLAYLTFFVRTYDDRQTLRIERPHAVAP